MSPAFVIAPAGDRVLSAGAYLAGGLELGLILAAIGFAAWRVRGALLPAWTGAPARVAEAVLATVGLLWIAEALGTFSAYGEATLIAGCLLAAVAAQLICLPIAERRAAGAVAPPAPPESSPVAAWLAAIAVAAVAAAWMVPTLGSLAGGMDRADTLWYHMPLATRFTDTGDLGAIDRFDPIFFASFYPANSEVLHSIPLLAFGRDIVSPLLNLGWVALALAAAYSIGRPYGVGSLSLIGGAIAVGAQNLVEFQAGEALNDIVGVAFVLCAVAVLVNAAAARGVRLGTPALAVAGLAAGVAAGVKLSFLAPVIALFVGVTVIAGAGNRVRSALWFALPAFAAGGYWYLRNLFAIGNPIPFTSFGPLGLPTPDRSFELRPGYSVFHYVTDLGIWKDWFFPGLDDSFGILWPIALAAFLGAGLYALLRASEPLLRVLGAVVLFTALAYVFTPLTAAGEDGMPIAFVWNVRYIAPAAAVGLALLPCLAPLRSTERMRNITLAGLSVLALATIGSLVQWQQGHVKGAIAAGVAVLGAYAALRWLRGRGLAGSGAPLAAGAALAMVVVLGALGAGWWEQKHYLERRYENLSPQLKLADAVRWARDVRDAKIAISGVRGVFNQYPFYGADLSNEVQWLGTDGPDGAFLRIRTCSEWRQALADGGYTHVVTMYDPFQPGTLTDTKEGLWTRTDPAAKQVMRDGPVSVFELTAPPDPASCGELPDLSPAELDGDSVNEQPTANQPPARSERGGANEAEG
jgi:hypothetical protein